MTRDKAISVDLNELTDQLQRWSDKISLLVSDAADEDAWQHAVIYNDAYTALQHARESVIDAAELMDPELTDALDYAGARWESFRDSWV